MEQADVLVPKGSLAMQLPTSQKLHIEWLFPAPQLPLWWLGWPWGAYCWSLYCLSCSPMFHQVKWIPLPVKLGTAKWKGVWSSTRVRQKRTESGKLKQGGTWAEVDVLGYHQGQQQEWLSSEKKLALDFFWKVCEICGEGWTDISRKGAELNDENFTGLR